MPNQELGTEFAGGLTPDWLRFLQGQRAQQPMPQLSDTGDVAPITPPPTNMPQMMPPIAPQPAGPVERGADLLSPQQVAQFAAQQDQATSRVPQPGGLPPAAQPVIANALAQLAQAPPEQQAKIYETLRAGARSFLDTVTPYVPPELRGKVQATGQVATMVDPIQSLLRVGPNVQEGKLGEAALDFLGGMPGQAISAGVAKAVPLFAGIAAKRAGDAGELAARPPARAVSAAPEAPPAPAARPTTTGDVAAQAVEQPSGVGFWAHPQAQEGIAPLPLKDVTQEAGKTGRRAAITATNFRDMPLDEANKAAAGMRHIIAKPDGTIVGAPAHIRTADDIARMRDQFDQTLRVGQTSNYNWYQDMRDMIAEGTRGMAPPTPRGAQPGRIGHNQGPPLDDIPAPKPQGAGDLLASELAHTSPQRQPDPNLGAAIRMHNAYELGKPLERFPTGRAASSYIKARDEGRPVREILGKKTSVYQKGLSNEQPWGTTGTNDIWHARAFDYRSPTGRPWDAALTPQQHAFMDGETILATKRANDTMLGGRNDWTPLEIQATAWIGKRAESYMAEGVGAEEAMQLAKRSYREAQDKYTAGVVAETTHGLKTRHRTDISEGSEQARQAHFDKMRWAEPGGVDPLYAGAGVAARPAQDATGIYQMKGGPLERNPAERFSPYVGRTGKTGQRQMDPESREVMKQVEQLRATLGVQNAAAFFMETPTNAVKRLTSMGFNPGGQLTIEQVQKLQEIGKKYGVGDVMHAGPGKAYSTDFMGTARPGFTKQKTELLGDELASEIPGAGAYRTELDTYYEPLHRQWQKKGPDPGGEGSGAVTRKLFKIFKSDKLMDNLAGEGGARARAHVQKLIDDNIEAQARGAPVRQDVMNLYKTLISSNVPGIDMRALQAAFKRGGVSLPAVMLVVDGLPDFEVPGLQSEGGRETL